MRRFMLATAIGLIALSTLTGTVSAGRTFGGVYANDAFYRVFGNKANVPDGTGTDPLATFTNSSMRAGRRGRVRAWHRSGHHGGRWAVYRATWTATGDPSELVTSWSELQGFVSSGELTLERAPAADFRCPVLGDPEPIG